MRRSNPHRGEVQVRISHAASVRISEWRYSPQVTQKVHSGPVLRLVLEGDLKESWEGSEAKLHPFSLIFEPARVGCLQTYHEHGRHLVIETYGSLGNSTRLDEITTPFVIYSTRAWELVSLLLKGIRSRKASSDNIRSCYQELLSLVATENVKSQTRPTAVQEMLQLIQQKFRHQGVVLKQLIRQLGHGVCHVSAKFSTYEHYSMNQYLRRLRVEYARFLILNSDLRLNEISLLAGFADIAHFTRAFKREIGSPPKTYQRQMEGCELKGERSAIRTKVKRKPDVSTTDPLPEPPKDIRTITPKPNAHISSFPDPTLL